MVSPKTTRAVYDAYESQVQELEKEYAAGRLSLPGLSIGREFIEKRFPTVMRDTYTFGDFSSYISFFISNGIFCPDVWSHERAHFREATRLGQKAEYVVTFFEEPNGTLGFHPKIQLTFDSSTAPSRKDLRQIVEAPEELSEGDEQLKNATED